MDRELIRAINETHKPVIASTGTAEPGDIFTTVGCLRDCPDLTLMYCVPIYPTLCSSIDLAQLDMVRNILTSSGRPRNIGFSSHCPKITPTLAAIARGATTIENHIIKYRSMKSCDSSSSLNFEDYKKLVKLVREMETINGSSQENL